MVKDRLTISLEMMGYFSVSCRVPSYSSLSRVTTIDASVLVRVHSILSRRKRIETLSPRKMPMRLMQRAVPVSVSSFGTVKMMAAEAATS